MTDDTAHDILTSPDVFETDVELNSAEITIEVEEPTIEELNAIDEDLPADAQEIDYARVFIDEFLLSPDVSGGEMGMTKALAVFGAMQTALQNSPAIQNAQAEMPLDAEGNP